MSVYDRWHKSRPKPGEAKCKCRPAKVPTAEHGEGKRWQVRWRDETGKPQKLNFERLPDAQSKDAQIKASLDRGDYIDPQAGRVTLEACARQWRSGLTGDPGSLMITDSSLSKWVYGNPIGQQTMGLLAKRPSLVQAWIKDMEAAGLQPNTIRGHLGVVSLVFDTALDDGMVGRNPCKVKSVRPPARVRHKVVPWTLERVEAVAAALLDPYSAMAYLGSGCGHRQGELFGIALDDIDFLARLVHVRRQVRIINGELVFSPPKGGKVRTVPLPDAIGLRLSAHIADHPPVAVTLPWVERGKPNAAPVTASILFPNPAGEAWNRNRFNKVWRDALVEVGVKPGRDNGCHALRHTAASAWLAAGVDIRTVAEFLGHSDPGFTLRTYTHLMPDASDRARKAMDLFFASVPSALVVPSEVIN